MSELKLIEMLENAGVSPEEARKRAASYQADSDADNKLSKSLEVLEEVALIQQEAEDRQFERLEKARSQAEAGLAEAIAPALDDLLTEQRAQNEALAKGLTGVLELVKSLRLEVTKMRDIQPRKTTPLAKSLDVIPSPNEEVQGTSREALFEVLTNTLAAAPDRASELMQATALLESGADPQTVANRFNLK